MALFEEIDPPSPNGEEELNKKYNTVRNDSLRFFNKTIENIRNTDTDRIFSEIKLFLSGSKYLPHFVLIILGIIVALTNIGQKMAAKAYANEMVTLNPDTMVSVSKNVDAYTPIINNGSLAVENYILASTSSDGFAANTVSVATDITDRSNSAVAGSVQTAAADNTDKTIKYTIKDGDTLTGLGWKYEVKLATLKYVNNIDNENLIKPGMEIKIPPKGYEVSASLIAKKENQKVAAASRTTVARSTASSRSSAPTIKAAPGSRSNAYPYGWCTYYIATRRYVPSQWGDAKNWLNSAGRAGYSTGSTPTAGAIVVTNESWWGHVAYVESVQDGSFTVSEMNYKGWGVTSRRTISTGDRAVRGFIY